LQIEKLQKEHAATVIAIKALDKDEGKTTKTIKQQKKDAKAMAKVNSDSITKLGESNKLTSQANKAKIATLEKDNVDRENEIKNLKNKQAIENKHLQTQVGTVDSAIKAIDAVDKSQKAENTKL